MSRGSRNKDNAVRTDETQAVGQFLRGLATRAEADPALAAQIQGALAESGLLPETTAGTQQREPTQKQSVSKAAAKRGDKGDKQTPSAEDKQAADTPPDPFQLLREQGEAGLRATLATLDLMTLRAIVRANRLDPAHISSRWSARERVIELIVTQVLARANFGKAFSRI